MKWALCLPFQCPICALYKPYISPMSVLCRPYMSPSYNASLSFNEIPGNNSHFGHTSEFRWGHNGAIVGPYRGASGAIVGP